MFKISIKNKIKQIFAFQTFILFILCLSACQATPEEQVIIGRQTSILEEAAENQQIDITFKEIETPSHVVEDYGLKGKAKVSYDAEVFTPETTAYPITRVEARTFTESTILEMIELLAGSNQPLYAEWERTKEEWHDRLLEVTPYIGTEKVNDDYVEYLQNAYENAETTTNNSVINISELEPNLLTNIYLPQESGEIAVFSVIGEGNHFVYFRNMETTVIPECFYSQNGFDSQMESEESFEWHKPDVPEITQEEAYDIAQNYLEALNIDLALFSTELCSTFTNSVEKHTGWHFTFTRKISNLEKQFYLKGSYINPDAMPSYGAPWEEEVVMMAIDGEGVCQLSWYGASIVKKIEHSTVELHAFDEMQKKIAQQLGYMYATHEADGVGLDIVVTKITLGTSLISDKDLVESGLYIPTWYVDYQLKWQGGKDPFEQQQIIFNAMDGSYIEPRVTNEDLMRMANMTQYSDD